MSDYTINMTEWFESNRRLTIAIDFDGTLVTHAYPEIGKDKGALKVLKLLQEKHNIVLNTMRSGKTLYDAVTYLNSNGINLYGANHNPSQSVWTNSPKVHAHIYIDDASLGIPLKWDEETGHPYVDWKRVKSMLKKRKVL